MQVSWTQWAGLGRSVSAPMRLVLAAVLTSAGTGAALAGGGHEACMEGHSLLARVKAAPRGFDAETGKDLQNYPPHRMADLRHMTLEIMIPDMNTPKLHASQTLKLTPVGTDLQVLTLDARGLQISSVAMLGRETRFEHDGRLLTVTFNPPLQQGEEAELVTDYTVESPALGLTWTPESPEWPGRAAQLHSQGQPESNSFWFPCRDYPNERMTTELIVRVPAGYAVSSNGRLASRKREVIATDSAVGTRRMLPFDTFHWVQDKPHVAYLVSLVVGKFDIVDVGDKGHPLPVYVPVGRGSDVEATFGRTKDMVAFFERTTRQPYPWDRYAQLVVHNFGAGGMENTGATTLFEGALLTREALLDHDMDGLISHELAHQWFGDLTTCNSWEHIWLNEGFATYMTALWFEHRDGAAKYQTEMLGNFDSVIGADSGTAPQQPGMASKVYDHPWEVFSRASNPYSKGASVLHMLRARLGDDNFFEAVRLYMDRRKFDTAETSDLRVAMEEVSGASLEQFFHQWVVRPGVPRLAVTPVWDAATNTLSVTVEQTQTIDGDNPAFEFDLPLVLGAQDRTSEARHETISVRGQTTTHEVRLDQEPAFIAVDPEMSVLAELKIRQTDAAWVRQLFRSPTVYARVQACRGMGQVPGRLSAGAAEGLRRTAANRKLTPVIRTEAVKGLVARGAWSDVRALATTAIDSWEVRLATTEALAQIATSDELRNNMSVRGAISGFLAERSRRDPSIKVRAAAVKALGDVGGEAAGAAIDAALATESQSDAIRQAGLEALAKVAPEGGIRMAATLTAPGTYVRTRPAAAMAVAKLAAQDQELAFRTLVGLLDDSDLRAQRAAGDALVELDDRRAEPLLAERLAGAPSEEHRAMYASWLEKLRS